MNFEERFVRDGNRSGGVQTSRHLVSVHVAFSAVVVPGLMTFVAFGAGKIAVVLAVRIDVGRILRHGLLGDFVIPPVAADAGFVLLFVDLEFGTAVLDVARRAGKSKLGVTVGKEFGGVGARKSETQKNEAHSENRFFHGGSPKTAPK